MPRKNKVTLYPIREVLRQENIKASPQQGAATCKEAGIEVVRKNGRLCIIEEEVPNFVAAIKTAGTKSVSTSLQGITPQDAATKKGLLYAAKATEMYGITLKDILSAAKKGEDVFLIGGGNPSKKSVLISDEIAKAISSEKHHDNNGEFAPLFELFDQAIGKHGNTYTTTQNLKLRVRDAVLLLRQNIAPYRAEVSKIEGNFFEARKANFKEANKTYLTAKKELEYYTRRCFEFLGLLPAYSKNTGKQPLYHKDHIALAKDYVKVLDFRALYEPIAKIAKAIGDRNKTLPMIQKEILDLLK